MQMRMEEDLSDQNELYTVLGVQQTATYEEVKKAFRAKALRWHPDKVDEDRREEAGEMFKKIKKAYDVLSDETKRKLYDQYGAASLEPFFEPPVVAPQPTFSFSFPMPPPAPQPHPAPQPSIFREPPEPEPPYLHRSPSFDPFFRPFPQPVPDIFDQYFAFPPQANAFMFTSHPTPGPAPAPNFFPSYHQPFAFPIFASPIFAPPEPQPVPPMPAPPPPSVFFYMSPSMVSQSMPYSPPASTATAPSVETSPDDEYFPPRNERQEPSWRWAPMQPQPPEPKLPKKSGKGQNFVNKLRRGKSTPILQPRRGWDEQDARRRRGNVSPSRGHRMKDLFNIFSKRQ